MIRVSFELDNGTTRFMNTVQAEDIGLAEDVMRSRYPEHDVRLVLPIDPETFFVREAKRVPAEPERVRGR